MKLAGSRFQPEEVVLCTAMLAFFIWIFVGAWSFSSASAVFPIMLSVPALVLLVLYILRGLLPETLNRVMMSSDRFSIGKKPKNLTSEHGTKDEANLGVYFVFGYTTFFSLAAYALGFYIAAILAIALYLTVVRRSLNHVFVVALILSLLALGIIYIFDFAYGYHYGSGAYLSFR